MLAWERVNLKQIVWHISEAWTDSRMTEVLLPDELLPVIRLRDSDAELVHAEQEWRQGDSILFLTAVAEEQAKTLLDGLHSQA